MNLSYRFVLHFCAADLGFVHEFDRMRMHAAKRLNVCLGPMCSNLVLQKIVTVFHGDSLQA